MEICNQETAYHALVYGLCHSTPQNGTYLTAARAVSAAKTALSTWQNAMLCNQLYVLSLAKATPAVAFNIKLLMAARAFRLPQCMLAEAKQACCLIPTATALRRQRPRLRAAKKSRAKAAAQCLAWPSFGSNSRWAFRDNEQWREKPHKHIHGGLTAHLGKTPAHHHKHRGNDLYAARHGLSATALTLLITLYTAR